MTDRKEKKIHRPNSVRNTLLLLAAISVIGLGLRVFQSEDTVPYTTALIVINSGSITSQIADTSEKRELGLGDRNELAPRHGMYFPFPVAHKWVFWMKGMRFPIDAVWMREGVVVDVTRDAQPPGEGDIERFSPSEPADAVLEMNAGEALELNIRKGDTVRMHY